MRIRLGVALALGAVVGVWKLVEAVSHPRKIVVFGDAQGSVVSIDGEARPALQPFMPGHFAVSRGEHTVTSGKTETKVSLGFLDHAVAVPLEGQCFAMLDYGDCFSFSRSPSGQCKPRVTKRYPEPKPIVLEKSVVFSQTEMPSAVFVERGKAPHVGVLRAVTCAELKLSDDALILAASGSRPAAVEVNPKPRSVFLSRTVEGSGAELLNADEDRALLRKDGQLVFLNTLMRGEDAVPQAIDALKTPQTASRLTTPFDAFVPVPTYASLTEEFPAMYGKAATIRVPVEGSARYGDIVVTFQPNGAGAMLTRTEQTALAAAGVKLEEVLDRRVQAERLAVENCLVKAKTGKPVRCAVKGTASEALSQLLALRVLLSEGQRISAQLVDAKDDHVALTVSTTGAGLTPNGDAYVPFVMLVGHDTLSAR
jgi:hypothetical protein